MSISYGFKVECDYFGPSPISTEMNTSLNDHMSPELNLLEMAQSIHRSERGLLLLDELPVSSHYSAFYPVFAYVKP